MSAWAKVDLGAGGLDRPRLYTPPIPKTAGELPGRRRPVRAPRTPKNGPKVTSGDPKVASGDPKWTSWDPKIDLQAAKRPIDENH